MRLASCNQYCALRRKSAFVYSLALCTVFTSLLLLKRHGTHFSVTSCVQFLRSRLRLGDLRSRSRLGDLGGTGSVPPDPLRCGNVFPDMLHGRWVPKSNVSERRRQDMEEYLHQLRGEYRIPRTLQRADGRCGNLPYDGVPLFRHMWFRALCNPKGPTPCCHNFRCTQRSRRDCRCPSCLDSRSPVHAELSDWMPARPECRPREFSANEACQMLRGTSLVLAGDSFVRHVFVALVMLLTDNFQDGALRKDAHPGTRSHCQGMYQINGLRCRSILDENRRLCNGTVQATYLEIFHVNKGRFLLPHLQKQASKNRKILLLLGVGIHDDFRADLIWPLFLQPLVEYVTNTSIPSANVTSPFVDVAKYLTYPTLPHTNPLLLHHNVVATFTNDTPNRKFASHVPFQRKWPRMIWLNTHAPGLLKSPLFAAQSFQGVRYYNAVIARLLEPNRIPVLDTFNMTAPLHAVDGTHYGYGANHLKVQFLLNWVKERQDSREW